MSQTPQVRKQALRSGSKQSPEVNVSRVYHSLQQLGVTNAENEQLNLEAVERLLHGPLGPALIFLSEHVLGRTETLSVRSQLHELQNGNLPKGILKEVFPASTAFAQYNRERDQNKTFQELEDIRPQVSKLESENDILETQLAGVKEEIQSKKEKVSAFTGLFLSCLRATETLRLYEEQLLKKRSNLEIPSLDAIIKQIPATILEVEQCVDDPKHGRVQSAGNTLFSWEELLTRSLQLSQSMTGEQEEPPTPIITCVQETLTRVRSEILMLKNSCSNNKFTQDEDNMASRLETLESRGDGIFRDKIFELARMRARRRINTEISALMVEKNVIYKDSKIEELKALRGQFERLLQAVQGLMVITNRLAVQLPEEIRLNILPLVDDIEGMKGALIGAIDRGVEDIS